MQSICLPLARWPVALLLTRSGFILVVHCAGLDRQAIGAWRKSFRNESIYAIYACNLIVFLGLKGNP